MKSKIISYKNRAKKKKTANHIKGNKQKSHDNQPIQSNVISIQSVISPELYEDDLLREEVIGSLRSKRRKTNGN